MKELFYFFGFIYIGWQIKEIIYTILKPRNKFIKEMEEIIDKMDATDKEKIKKEGSKAFAEILIGFAMFGWIIVGIFHTEESKWFLLNLILNISLWIFFGILSLLFWKKENFNFISIMTNTKDTAKNAINFFDTSFVVIINRVFKIGITFYILCLHFHIVT